ncbi:hypothetical protein APA91_33575 [Pseudomonas aeruginosa]|nr:hypothetical protein AO945_31905 [Pseudomonas aeruginosa]OPE24497.1 hypothetical protein APA91_33575 [Pseudomonas aeruginosa]OPE31720.1 hypothetical protein APB28_35880 [Pseudomonas aeruginosa]RPO29283.1 hypothetical protein IPC1221_07945 [Pseudomonas aeruginosa]RPW44568.1 hypothetical protein IPC747_04580 [Pseudomonas aeruginosa]
MTAIPKTRALAVAISTHCDSSRTRKHPVRVWLLTPTHRRRLQREAGLHAWRIYRRATRTWQVNLPSVRNTDPDDGAGAGYRQRYPDRRNGNDPYTYLKDVLTRLPTQRASEIGQLLPHQWVPA